MEKEQSGILYTLGTSGMAVTGVVSNKITEAVIDEIIDGVPVTSIRKNAFYGCLMLKKVILPDTIIKLGDCAFKDCYSLTEFVFPPLVTVIPYEVLSNCHKIKVIALPESAEEIGVRAFFGCSSLKEIVIPSNVSMIMDRAFADCFNLNDITILSDCIVKLGYKPFYNCRRLDSLTIIYEKTGISFFSQMEFSKVKNIKLRVFKDNSDSYEDIKVFVPDDENKDEYYSGIHRAYINVFASGFTWKKYDRAFNHLKNVENQIDVAAYRIICRYGLTEMYEKQYVQVLKKHFKEAVRLFISYNDTMGLEALLMLGFINRVNIARYIELSKKLESSMCEDMLLNYRNEYFTVKPEVEI